MSRDVPIDRITHIQSVTTRAHAKAFLEDGSTLSCLVPQRPFVRMYLRERTDLLIVLTLIFNESEYDQEQSTRDSYRYVLDTFKVTDALRSRIERELDL
ncbi:hypothetical protein IHN63_00605 [Deinococcus sp. 6YEL10]|uniref:hypothetical protein n=1 Tax=Deinococcus sp. 6YEL10 TaxID=2745870 RepID=UPI001E6499C3|nr:hypothetical protein [Deinococcus sp. 6YEL10]MCD0159800.1 hypothetical protein [Deinococcus sp. 6YEL10]